MARKRKKRRWFLRFMIVVVSFVLVVVLDVVAVVNLKLPQVLGNALAVCFLIFFVPFVKRALPDT